ncbi:prevent-host-death family protein [Paramicrobacterium humi]|uniref:Prevent-host-death family protein n=1 Tax=Paramicrobacterium humi TaxID=640635 RepID=A0A1H4P7A0_9MICO|nr:type II toxin-antitoxin system prevent-host-death family antitoxin [Microbacterium humi]SEC03259.1 prevent-host-death family protein [Microbacterium humi]
MGWSTIRGPMEVTVQEAKTHLSRLLRRVEAGETVVIKRGQVRVALLTSALPQAARRQIWGDVQGRLASDFDEIPRELEDYAS